MYPMNFPDRKARRKVEAEARQKAASERTPAQQLARLDELLGVGQGAKNERLRLTARLNHNLEKKA